MPPRGKTRPAGRRPVARRVEPRRTPQVMLSPRRPSRRGRSVRFRRRAWAIVLVVLLLAASATYLFMTARGGVALSALSSWGTVERTVKARTLVWRQELIVTAPAGGVVRLAVREGERVRLGQPLMELVDLEDRRDLEARLADVEKRLALEDAGRRAERERLEDRLARATAAYHESLADLVRGSVERRPDLLAGAWSALTAAARARAGAESGLNQLDRERQELVALRQDLLAGLEATGQVVAAQAHGLVSLVLDGLEGLSRRDLEGIGTWDLLSLREERAETGNGRRVSIRDPVCKIIDPQGVTLATVLSAQAAAGLEAGAQITIRFPELGQAVLRGEVARLGPVERTGSRVVLVTTDGVLAGLSSLRWTACELLLLSRSGVIVPSGALTTRDGQRGVIVLSRTSAHFRPVTVLAAEGRSVLVEGIARGTAVALYPWLWSLLGRVRGLSG